MLKKIIVGVVILVLITIGGFFVLRKPAEKAAKPTEELVVEDTLKEMEEILELGEEIVALEGQQIVDNDFVEEYIQVEDRFFELRDAYFAQNLSENKIREEINQLLEDIEALETKLQELKQQEPSIEK